jgi:uncharacterized protein YkwD
MHTTTVTPTTSLTRRTAIAIAIAVLATLCYLIPTAHDAGAIAATPGTRDEIVESFRLLNLHRSRHGAPALRYSPGLSAKARAWATHMANTGRFEHSVVSHNVPPGWRGLGENIAYNTTVRTVITAWAHSPGHNANMLNPNYDNVGIGLARIGNRLYAVQVFGDYLP